MPAEKRSGGATVGVVADRVIDRFYAEVGRRVRVARLSAGFTQDELAGALLLARSSIANLEAGRQRVPAHTLLLASRALNIELIDLLPDLELDVTPAEGFGLLPDTPQEHVQLLQRLMSSVSERTA